MKISPVNNFNYKNNLNKNVTLSTPKFKADTIEFSSKVSFKGNLELNLKAMMYARQADKILSQAKQVRLSQYEVIEDAQELQKEAGRLN